MRTIKTTFIVTVYNEEKTINRLLDSLFNQTQKPDEVIIVDGGSADKTVAKIKKYKTNLNGQKPSIKVVVKKGNRSVGRNEAVKHASYDVILCSDSGNTLDKNWIKNICSPFTDEKVDLVAGYYEGRAKTIFQKSVIPYALVMPDKVNPKDFLPATRSVAFRKSVWKKVGGFDESLSHNEDYVFARKVKKKGVNTVFAKDAIVYWMPRNNLKQTFTMLWRFAFGDAEAKILRTNVMILFARYILGFYFLFLCLLYKSIPGLIILMIFFILYLIWSIQKNYRYVKHIKALIFLPVLQLTADTAVLSGTILGNLKRLKKIQILSTLKSNKLLTAAIVIYSGVLLATIHWGAPNENRPYPFHMDEWHQLQAIANTFRYGTPNTEGSANGTMFHFLYSGFYLIPFTLLQIINPFSLDISNLLMREKVFEVIRLQTIIFGLLSIIVLYKIAQVISASRKVAILLFTFTPIWLMLSGYFKYDIALIFWILISLLFMLKYIKEPSNKNYLLAAVPVGLAFAVKVSAAPLFILFAVSYFWFNPLWKKRLKYFVLGIIFSVSCAVIFGMPDMLFGKGNIIFFLQENVIKAPAVTSNFNLSENPYLYLITRHYPIIFGYGLYAMFLASCLFWVTVFIFKRLRKKLTTYKYVLFLFFGLLIFSLSLIPLQIYAGGNRSLVLLPFIVLLPALAFNFIEKYKIGKAIVIVLVILIVSMQIYSSIGWMYMKFVKSPQEISSEWIIQNIEKDEIIGIENIPIYQGIPDILLKGFYVEQHISKSNSRYQYQVLDSKTKILPAVVILTNGDVEANVYKSSEKKTLFTRLHKEGYKKSADFQLDRKLVSINDKDFYLSWLISSPITVSVYTK